MDEDKPTSTISTPRVKYFNHTPKRTLLQQHLRTPIQRLTQNNEDSSKEDRQTPVSANPFEVKAESLYFSSCSPSVFATFARNKSDSGQFRWSIDHVSVLYPADIDETSIPKVLVDPEHEMRAQKAIDTFFSQNSIVPSPWSSDSEERRECKFRRARMDSMLDISSSEVATQTMVTVPPDVDLSTILGNKYLYNDKNDFVVSPNSSSNSGSSFRDSDVMSVSSLRRKLFVADENCKTPSRLERKDLYLAKQWCSPTSSTRSIHSTPSDLLSSSPITPPNCSESCNSYPSPQMSPIARSSQKIVRMRSFNERLDEESNSHLIRKASSEYMDAKSEISMSFCMDSQNISTFQSNTSQKQDTGYRTSSINSMQSVASDNTSGFPSRSMPVMDTFSDYGVSNGVPNILSINNNDMSIDEEKFQCNKYKEHDSGLCGSNGWPLVPNCCSTPAFNL